MVTYLVVGITIALTITGDYFLKVASLNGLSWLSLSPSALIGGVCYFISAFGWIYLMKNANLLVVGVVYSCATIIILTIMGIVVFNEQITTKQLIGLALALVAITITTIE